VNIAKYNRWNHIKLYFNKLDFCIFGKGMGAVRQNAAHGKKKMQKNRKNCLSLSRLKYQKIEYVPI